ncbi:MAG: hypothetical protein AAB574_01770, partial [Patescibacteria group bacterium]
MGFCHRRSIRLKNYDYRRDGFYFVTIDVQDKRKLFWENEAEKISVSGAMIKELIGEMEFKYPGVWVDEYVVMPDHVHMIIRLKNNRPMDGNGNGRTRGSARTENISLAEVVQPMDGNGNVGANPRICPLNGINNRPMDGNGNGRTRGSAR